MTFSAVVGVCRSLLLKQITSTERMFRHRTLNLVTHALQKKSLGSLGLETPDISDLVAVLLQTTCLKELRTVGSTSEAY